MREWSGRDALRRAALVSAVLAAALLPVARGAGAADGVDDRAQSLQEQRVALAGTEQGALLALYGAEASLARARDEAATLEGRTQALAREEAAARRRAAVVQRSLAASQARVARTLRELYIAGDADPIAVVLGAASLDEVVAGIEGLQRATALNQRLAEEARTRAAELSQARVVLAARREAAERARDEARAAADGLARAVADRRATLDEIRARASVTERQLERLRAEARAASERSAELTRAAAPATSDAPAAAEAPAAAAAPATSGDTPAEGAVDGGGAVAEPVESTPSGDQQADVVDEAGSAEDAGSVVPPPGQSRTLVVDAVAYHLPGRTASGLPVGPGIVAVDPSVIPLGTRLFVPGYGPAIAADTGSAVKGLLIDLWMPSLAEARAWGRRTVTITIYG